MRNARFTTLLSAIAGATLSVPASAQQDPEATIAPLPIAFDHSGMSGPGAAPIEKAMANSQFVILGEDHGYADSPRLLAALAGEGKPLGFDHYVVEVGPIETQWVSAQLKQGIDSYGDALGGRPLAVPFLNLREEAEAARPFAIGGKLLGIDQEFIGSTLIHLERLIAEAPSAGARAAAGIWLEKEREAFATGNQGGVMMMAATPDDWKALGALYSGNGDHSALIDAMAKSASVYRHYLSGRGLDNNLDRVAMIREYFLSHYREIEHGSDGPPKFLFKMGATHAGHATSSMNTFDIGSLIEGMAAANGMDALHIAYLPLEGSAIAMQPSKDGFFSEKKTDAKDLRAMLVSAGVDLSVIDKGSGHFVIDLEPVRRALQNKGLGALDRMTRFVVLGFDYLVTTNEGRPATPLATN